jgi:hypothetical protein
MNFRPFLCWCAAGLIAVCHSANAAEPASIAGGTTIAMTPPAGSSAPVSREPVMTKIDGETLYSIGFDKLSAFPYTIVDAGTGATPEQIADAKKRDQVPDWIRIYHDKRVVLTGYMMPLQVENGRAKKFVMMKDVNTCCYGAVPNMNDYVVVSMKGEGVVAVQDVPVLLIGTMKIEEKYESGYITALLSMEGEKFLGPPKK